MRAYIERNKEALLLFAIAFGTRLIAWPWAQNTEADAASRILLSEDLLQNMRIISSGHWPSLHFYFNALFIWIFQDRVTGPTFLSILLGSISVVPFYLFTRNVFSKAGAFWATLIFTFSGVIFRHSFHALAEIYHVCFCLSTMYFISQVVRVPEKKYRYAIYAGITATIATGGRFEAWLLVGLLGAVLLLMKEYKAALVYGSIASIFPLSWMIGNYIAFKDPIYSLHSVEHFNFDIGGVNDVVDRTEHLKRIVFFPISWMVAITPVTAFIIIGIIAKRSFRRTFTREQFLYLCIAVFFFITFIVKCFNGSLVIAHRFTVTLVFVSMPFFALWFERAEKTRARKIVAATIAAGLIPFSFFWQYIPVSMLFHFNERMQNVIDATVYFTYPQTQAIPRLTNPATEPVVDAVNKSLKPGDAVLVDFSEWESTYYIGLNLGVTRWDEFVISGGAHYAIPFYEMEMFLQNHPKGKLIMSDWSQFDLGTHLHGNVMDHDSLMGSFVLKPVVTVGHLRAFEYVYVLGETRDRYRAEAAGQPPMYTAERDLLFYKTVIVEDQNWYLQVIRQARDAHRSVEGMVEENAQWMIDHATPAKGTVNDTTNTQ